MTKRPDDIRISDLAEPVLTPFQKTVIEAAEQMPVSFSEEAVVEEAIERTGLSDFGPEDFRERLRVWLASADEDADLGPVGRLGVYRDIVRYAANRLRFEDLLRRHPEILDVEIERPIIIAGLPRSGTTHLLNLIAADQRLRSLPYWESLEPIPDPAEAPVPGAEDPRLVRCRESYAQQDAVMPLLKNMHDMNPEHIHEEIEVQGLDFSSYELEWIATVPRWRDYYLSHDQTPHYEYLKKVLQALQWLRGPDRWILKSPQHIGDRVRRKRVDPRAVSAYWIDRIECLLRACVRDRDRIPASQSIDVLFHEFMADDVATVERIYELAGLAMTPEARAALDRFMAKNPRGKHGRILYDLKLDFGVDPEDLRKRFDFYFQRFPMEIG
jgi:hypothetical protein